MSTRGDTRFGPGRRRSAPDPGRPLHSRSTAKDAPRKEAEGDAFVGRNRELAELMAALDDAIEGRGTVVLLAGEAGIGKTALAAQLARHAVTRGARALWGRSWEDSGAPSYWPWAQIVRALAHDHDEETLRSYVDRRAAQIGLLAPDLARAFGHPAGEAGPADSHAGRFYVFEAVTRLLANASSVRPLVLLLDDIVSADCASLLLLRFLAQEVRESRLLVVATYREADVKREREAIDAIADLVREGRALTLRGLSRDEVRQLVADLSGTPPSEENVAAIHQATEGNPLFVREVTRLVAAQQPLDRPGPLAIPIPETVRAVIQKRLARLSADAVRVLAVAAVVGRDFELSLVAPASGLPTEDVLTSLSEAVAAGVVVEESGAAGLYRFSHALTQEAIYKDLPIAARMQLHREVGETIERLHGSDPSFHLAELAHHFAKAAPAGEAEKARVYASKAGDRAMDSCAYEEAVLQYRRALEARDFTGQDDELHCDLLLRLGGAEARAAAYQDAKATFLRAAAIARKLGDGERLAHAALGFGEPQVEGGLVDRALIDLLEEALDRLAAADSGLRARVLARLSLELTFSDEAERREALSREAVAMARRVGDVASLVGVLRARWMAAWGPPGLDERSQIAEEILRLARETADRETELVGRARRITCSLEAGDMRMAEADIAAHARVAAELRMPFHEWTAASLRAMRALLEGSFEAAEELAEQALALEPRRPNSRFAHLEQLTTIRWEQGRLGELRPSWQDVLEQFPQAGFARGWICLADAALGRKKDARTGLRLLADQVHELPRDGIWLSALALASLATAELDESGVAERVYPLLRPHADSAILIPMPHPVICFGSASLYLALLAAAMARWEHAAAHFEAAIAANARLGAKPFLAHAEWGYARMLIRRGRAGDRDRALALLDRAARAGDDLGMSRLRGEIDELRALAGGEALCAEPARNLFRREGDYWTVVYDGSLVRLRDSKGLRHLATLLANPGHEFHAVDLDAMEHGEEKSARGASGHGFREAELEVRPDLGDAGEMLDAQAKAAYKARLEDLREELDEAQRFNDPVRAAKAKEEIDFLARELARAVGLGGRDRRAASHAERARLNVTRAIRAAIAKLAEGNPALGQHLAHTIQTGRYCAYKPDPRTTIVWER